MTETQIQKYEACKKYLSELKKWKSELPFNSHYHGRASTSPLIQVQLEEIHVGMYTTVRDALDKAITDVESIIKSL